MSTDDTWQSWFERVWKQREEEVYPSLFGTESIGIYPLSARILTETFKQESIDPRWLHYGVFQFAPTAQRPTWLYVTSGMSNAWESTEPNPSEVSGMGCEFILESTMESQWAIIRLLHVMAFQILLAHGRYPGKDLLEVFHRIPLRGPITGDSKLTWLMLAPPVGVPDVVQLESGQFNFFHVVALTEAEAAFARETGGTELLKRLLDEDHHPAIDPTRESVIT